VKIIKHSSLSENQIIAVLQKGGLVVSPSDTVYGLLVDATNQAAVKKLIQLKNRPWGKPISVFVSDFVQLRQLVRVDTKQLNLLKSLLPGPFTVILNSKRKVCPLLESERKTLGVRLVSYPFITDLIKKFGKPLTATSANLAGQPPHYSLVSFLKSLPKKKAELIDLAIDAGNLPRNKTSTIIDLSASSVKILRQGDLIFQAQNRFISYSPEHTQKLAQYLLKRFFLADKPLVFILKGELGVGKTVFVKGLGKVFNLQKIISPTFVIYYEYKISKGKFYHFDLYQIEDEQDFTVLQIEKMLLPGNILCFEWGEKMGGIIDLLIKKATVVCVVMEYKSEKERQIGYKVLGQNQNSKIKYQKSKKEKN